MNKELQGSREQKKHKSMSDIIREALQKINAVNPKLCAVASRWAVKVLQVGRDRSFIMKNMYIFKLLMFSFSCLKLPSNIYDKILTWNQKSQHNNKGVNLPVIPHLSDLFIPSVFNSVSHWYVGHPWPTCTQRWTLMSVGGIAGNTTWGQHLFDWRSDFNKTSAYILLRQWFGNGCYGQFWPVFISLT